MAMFICNLPSELALCRVFGIIDSALKAPAIFSCEVECCLVEECRLKGERLEMSTLMAKDHSVKVDFRGLFQVV